jgi:hypothetical protein
MVHRDGQGDIVWHSGGVNGFRAFVGYAPEERIGVAVLSNASAGPCGIDDIGFHLLDKARPLAPMREEAPVASDGVAALEGRYAADAGWQLTIVRQGDRLMLQGPTGKPARLFAEDTGTWFLKVADIQFRFIRSSTGQVTGLTMQQGGMQTHLARMPGDLSFTNRAMR